MALKLVNHQGEINLDYQVVIESNGDIVSLSLFVTPPGASIPVFMDLISGTEGKTYIAKLTSAYLKAEEKWGIELTKIDIDFKAA